MIEADGCLSRRCQQESVKSGFTVTRCEYQYLKWPIVIIDCNRLGSLGLRRLLVLEPLEAENGGCGDGGGDNGSRSKLHFGIGAQ